MTITNQNLRPILVGLFVLFCSALLSCFILEKNTLSYILFVFLVALTIFPAFKSKKFDVFEIINWMVLYFFISMGLRMVPIFYNKSLYLYGYGTNDYFKTVNMVLFCSALALIGLYAGYYCQIGQRIAGRMPLIKLHFSKKRIILYLLVGALVNLLVFIVYIRNLESSGINIKSAHDVTVSNIVEGGRGLYTVLGNLFAGTMLLSVYLYLCWKKKIWVNFFFLVNIGLVVLNFVFVGSKGNVIYLVLTIMICYHYCVKNIKFIKIALYLFPIILLSPFIWFYRAFGLQNLPGLFQRVLEVVTREPFLIVEPFLSRSFGADMFFLIVDKTPSEYPFRYGKTFLSAIWALVPRQVWRGKPWSLGVQFNSTYLAHASMPESSVAPSLIGEFYLNFHILGIVVGFFLLGIMARFVFDYCIKRNTGFEGVCLYLFFFPILVQGLEGPLTDHFVYFPFFKVISLLVLFFVFKGKILREKS